MSAGRRSWTESVGAISASSTTVALNLDRRPDLPAQARIVKAILRNDSEATLTCPGVPGAAPASPGERVEIPCGDSLRVLVLENDAIAVSSGQVKVHVEVEW